VSDPSADYSSLTPDQAIRRIKKLEQEMLKHARNLEFEQAARLRDEIHKLRNVELGLTG
jgi:excinuclease ABC subunit B